MSLLVRLSLTLVAPLLAISSAQASVVISGTRVVYPASEREVTIRLDNKGKSPSLVQAWLDLGDETAKPDTIDVPFTLTPPIFRMEPGRGQTLRLLHTGEALPQDKETVFWLNVLDIPPKPDSTHVQNHMQFAFRTRIKVFYRPKGLALAVSDAPAKLAWKAVPVANGFAVEVNNPTPYHVSYSTLELTVNGNRHKKAGKGGGMVAPGETLTIPIEGLMTRPDSGEVSFTVINDYGAQVPLKATLSS